MVLALIAAGFGVSRSYLRLRARSPRLLSSSTLIAVRLTFPIGESTLFLDMRRLWQSSQGIAATQTCLTFLGFSDIVVAKHFFAPVEAGIYSAIALTGKVLLFLVGFVPLLVLPRAVSRRAANQRGLPDLARRRLFLAAPRAAVLLAFGIAPG